MKQVKEGAHSYVIFKTGIDKIINVLFSVYHLSSFKKYGEIRINCFDSFLFEIIFHNINEFVSFIDRAHTRYQKPPPSSP